jgi:hypothetical protein
MEFALPAPSAAGSRGGLISQLCYGTAALSAATLSLWREEAMASGGVEEWSALWPTKDKGRAVRHALEFAAG